MPPQPQRGGISLISTSRVSTWVSHSMHRCQAKVPWNSITSVFPAIWCSPSTFWVITVCNLPSASNLASPLWQSLGCAWSMTSFMSLIRRFQTFTGSCKNESMWATSMGSYFSQRPPLPLKAGIPLSIEAPAPVKAVTILAPYRSCAAFLIKSSNLSSFPLTF